jgi:hypothetical protein
MDDDRDDDMDDNDDNDDMGDIDIQHRRSIATLPSSCTADSATVATKHISRIAVVNNTDNIALTHGRHTS